MSDIRSCLYTGTVTHQRLQPFTHFLRYRVFAMLLDLRELPTLDKSRWFGVNRFAPLAFRDRDHGARDGSSALVWAENQLDQAGLGDAGADIRLLCFPSILGYVFNPISVYFCSTDQGKLRAVIYEVKNTFGQQHSYLFPVEDAGQAAYSHSCAKEFYVSPFIPMQADYSFTLQPPDRHFSLFIRQTTATGELLRAHWNGQRMAWSSASLLRCFIHYPLLTVKIMFGIHWQALKLWRKGAKFHSRPALPPHDISVIK